MYGNSSAGLWKAKVTGVWSSQISRQSAHEGGDNVISPTHQPPFTQEIFLLHTSRSGLDDSKSIVRLEGLYKLKSPVVQTGIKPTTIRLVDQCLNQLLHRVPLFFLISLNIFKQTPCFHKIYFIFAPNSTLFFRENIVQFSHKHTHTHSDIFTSFIHIFRFSYKISTDIQILLQNFYRYSDFVTKFLQIFRFCYKISTDIQILLQDFYRYSDLVKRFLQTFRFSYKISTDIQI